MDRSGANAKLVWCFYVQLGTWIFTAPQWLKGRQSDKMSQQRKLCSLEVSIFFLFDKRPFLADLETSLKHKMLLNNNRWSAFEWMVTLVLTVISWRLRANGQNAEDCKERHAKAKHCEERHYLKIPVKARQFALVNTSITDPKTLKRKFGLADHSARQTSQH